MAAEFIRIAVLAIVFVVVMVFVLVLVQTVPSGERALGKEMIVRYVFTVFLLLVVQIVGLGLMFLLHWSRQATVLESSPPHHMARPSD